MWSLVSAFSQAPRSTSTAHIVLKRDGTVNSWNNDMENMEGYSAKDVIGKKFTHFFSSLDASPTALEKIIQRTLQKGKTKYRGIHFRKDGSILRGYIELRTLCDETNEVIGFKLSAEKQRSYPDFNPYPLITYSCKKLMEYGKNGVKSTLGYFLPKKKPLL